MNRISAFVIAILALSFAPPRAGLVASQRNAIRGVIVSSSTREPVAGAYAIAYSSDLKAPIVSPLTGGDGKFQLVVPQTTNDFLLQVHDKQVRYWDYKPSDPYPNKTHPNNLPVIELKDRHGTMAAAEIRTQVEAAQLLHSIGDSTALALLDRVAEVFRQTWQPPKFGGCRAAVPRRQVAMVVPASYDRSRSDFDTDDVGEIATSLLSEKLAANAIREVNAAEQIYYKEHGKFADSTLLSAEKLITDEQLVPPDYCIDILLVGATPVEQLANSYRLVGAPDGRSSPSVTLYSASDQVIRYRFAQESSLSPEGSEPIGPDFPLDIHHTGGQ